MKAALRKAQGPGGWLVLAAFVVLASGSGLFDALERKAYDAVLRQIDHQPSARVHLVSIDEVSLARLGPWPWPRTVHAQLIERLNAAQVRLIVNTERFDAPEPGWAGRDLRELWQRYRALPGAVAEGSERGPFGVLLADAVARLDGDARLAAALANAGRVLLSMQALPGAPAQPAAGFVRRQALTPGADPAVPEVPALRAPIARLSREAAGIGYLAITPDPFDGVVRSAPLLLSHAGLVYPALALLAAVHEQELSVADIVRQPGDRLQIDTLQLHTDPAGAVLPYYYPDEAGRPAFARSSFADVLAGKVSAATLRDRIVLIGPTSAELVPTYPTPRGQLLAPVELLAHQLSSLLEADYLRTPAWAGTLRWVLMAVLALYLVLGLPRLKAGPAAMLSAGLLVSLLTSHLVLLRSLHLWLPLMSPATLLLFGHLLLAGQVGSRRVQLASQARRQRGLALLAQGRPERAFDKLLPLAVDGPLMEPLYQLARDFEQRRQFDKAEAVYRHMAAFDPLYKDLVQRLRRACQMAVATRPGAMPFAGRGSEPVMLGRYLVEQELGKGAMGVVYQGLDPKIGRVVAIKTMALSQAFEPGELAEARRRFFREAETAGRLNHPNIVTIYDAGEEHELAYIAMEFVRGRDLTAFTRAGQLLPLTVLLPILIQVAEALDYAHRQHIAHRDIKPANIMYEAESGAVKVTDFGIARLTDASRTRAGTVLGTPGYMSPEQLAGQKIDGRSDLFSLGVMLYQLCTGALPFAGESLAELMQRICSQPYRNPAELNPQLPAALVAVIDRALKKSLEERFQSGREFADALKQCVAS